MAYNKNIPQPDDQKSDSQAEMLNNFKSIYQFVDQDHEIFDSADEGKHKQAVFTENDNSSATGASEVLLHSANSAYLANYPTLFLKRESLGATTTGYEIASSDSGSVGGNDYGWTITPAGILIKWGTENGVAAGVPGDYTITFPVAADIPVFGVAPQVMNVAIESNADCGVFSYVQSTTALTLVLRLVQRCTSIPIAYPFNIHYVVCGSL